jgi:mRNA interferase HigB
MRIISRKTLKDFYESHRDAEGPLVAWFREAENAAWKAPADIKAQYRNASILKDRIVVFNIAGNKYRLVVKILYQTQTVYVRFVDSHAEYDTYSPEGW